MTFPALRTGDDEIHADALGDVLKMTFDLALRGFHET
jgi:hypothetical protein